MWSIITSLELRRRRRLSDENRHHRGLALVDADEVGRLDVEPHIEARADRLDWSPALDLDDESRRAGAHAAPCVLAPSELRSSLLPAEGRPHHPLDVLAELGVRPTAAILQVLEKIEVSDLHVDPRRADEARVALVAGLPDALADPKIEVV